MNLKTIRMKIEHFSEMRQVRFLPWDATDGRLEDRLIDFRIAIRGGPLV